jgi:hypothetical protein
MDNYGVMHSTCSKVFIYTKFNKKNIKFTRLIVSFMGRDQLLGAIGRNGVKWPIKVRICFYLAKHLKTVLGTRKNHRTLNRTLGKGVDNYGIVHSM